MTHLLRQFSNGELLALIAIIGGLFLPILGGITIAITKVVAAHFRRIELDDREAALKMEMIERGMSADEIARILQARMAPLSAVRMEMSGVRNRE
jgi:hypothetical protein